VPFRQGSGDLTSIALEQVADRDGRFDREWHLTRGFFYDQPPGTPAEYRGHPIPRTIEVKADSTVTTDLASVPHVFWSLIASYGRQTAAALLHDQEATRAGTLTPAQAVIDERHWIDLMFQRALREQGIPRLRARLMWALVSIQSFIEPAPARAVAIIAGAAVSTAAMVLAVLTLLRMVTGTEPGRSDWAQLALLAIPIIVLVIANASSVARLMGTLILAGFFFWPIVALQLAAVGLFRLVELVAKLFDPQREQIARPTASIEES
jgi:hypothetical protein